MSAQTASAPRRSALASLPRPATRLRTSENQMSMFALVSVGAVAFMMLLPSPRAAFASVDPNETAVAISVKGGSVAPPSATDRACAGQVWGSESLDCILAIARDGGIDRAVRFADAGVRH